jgi:hypothetical protein
MVPVTYGDVGIDGPALSELVVISVVEISVSVDVDSYEKGAVPAVGNVSDVPVTCSGEVALISVTISVETIVAVELISVASDEICVASVIAVLDIEV